MGDVSPAGGLDGPTPLIVPELILPDGANDDFAQKEAAAFAQGKLNKFKRDESLHGHIHIATIGLVWMYFVGLAIMGGVWLWHLVMPPKYYFLEEPQKDKLETAFFTAVGSSALADKARKINQNNNH